MNKLVLSALIAVFAFVTMAGYHLAFAQTASPSPSPSPSPTPSMPAAAPQTGFGSTTQ